MKMAMSFQVLAGVHFFAVRDIQGTAKVWKPLNVSGIKVGKKLKNNMVPRNFPAEPDNDLRFDLTIDLEAVALLKSIFRMVTLIFYCK